MAAGKITLRHWDAVESWREVTYVKVGDSGSGGSSDVYITLATSGPRRGITFAVKMFSAADREGWRLSFMREVHILRDCDHPAIVKVLDEGTYRDKYPFFVMEYLPDKLSRFMKPGMLDDRAKLGIVMQVLSALNYLSRRDPPAVHRDIKPSNIFIKKDSCVLGDFGLILQVTEAAREDVGKPAAGSVAEMARKYRTPELVAYHNGGSKPPPASDVFQLGLVAAELFTGKNPLLPDRPESPLRMQAIPEIPGQLGEAIRSLIDQMIIKEVTKRPSASDMLGKWQELFLRLCRREHAERKAAWMKKATEEVAPATPAAEKPPARPQRQFGEGIFDESEATDPGPSG